MPDPASPIARPLGPFGPGISQVWPNPSPTGEAGVIAVTADLLVTDSYGRSLDGKLRGTTITQTQRVRLRLQFVDHVNHAVMDLRDYGFISGAVPPEPMGDVEPEPGPTERPYVRFRFAEATGACPTAADPDDTRVESAELGLVSCPVPADVVNNYGVYMAEAGMFDGLDNLMYANTAYLLVEPSLFGAAAPNIGIPTLQEMRVVLRDHPSLNRLIDEYEFDAADVCNAIVRCIFHFNNTSPISESYIYNTRNFPWKAPLMQGIAAYLFESAATYYRRNKANVQAGGVTVGDLDKEKEYLQASQMQMQQWQKFVKDKKIEMNMAEGYGTLGSSYGYWNGVYGW